MNRNLTRVWILSLLVLGLVVGTSTAAALPPSPEKALTEAAPKVIDFAKKNDWKKVGFLKFLVRIGKGPLRDNAGMLNFSLPDRLETALILQLSRRDKIGVLANTNESIASNKRVNHLTERGREAFFNQNPSPFRLAWGNKEPVQPDAFFTGEVTVAPDLNTMNIKVQAFSKDSLVLQDVCSFEARTDLRTLTDLGFSFDGTRGGFGAITKKRNVEEYKKEMVVDARHQVAVETTQDKWDQSAESLLKSMKNLPVQFTPLYADEPVAVGTNPYQSSEEASNILLRMPTPQASEPVAFRLQNTSKDTTYGVVLKINGKSTIFEEAKAPSECYKWILTPGMSLTIKGFQKSHSEREDFNVLTPEQSADKEVSYNVNLGTCNLVVFAEAKTEAEIAVLNSVKEEEEKVEEVQQLMIISRGMEDTRKMTRPYTLTALQLQLKADMLKGIAGGKGRGLIDAGPMAKSQVKEEKFEMMPLPIFSATIRYYDSTK